MTYLTSRQKELLDFLRRHIVEKGYVPSYKEMADGCFFSSPSSVMYQLQQLAAKGKISLGEGKQRAIVILEDVAYESARITERHLIADWLEEQADQWVKPTSFNFPRTLDKLAAQIRAGVAPTERKTI